MMLKVTSIFVICHFICHWSVDIEKKIIRKITDKNALCVILHTDWGNLLWFTFRSFRLIIFMAC